MSTKSVLGSMAVVVVTLTASVALAASHGSSGGFSGGSRGFSGGGVGTSRIGAGFNRSGGFSRSGNFRGGNFGRHRHFDNDFFFFGAFGDPFFYPFGYGYYPYGYYPYAYYPYAGY